MGFQNFVVSNKIHPLKKRIIIKKILLLPGPGNQAVGRFVIMSYFYGLLSSRSKQVAGTYGVTRRQVADSPPYGCAYMCACL